MLLDLARSDAGNHPSAKGQSSRNEIFNVTSYLSKRPSLQSAYVNVIGVIGGPFAVNGRKQKDLRVEME